MRERKKRGKVELLAHIKLAPSEQISALLHAKCVRLPLSAPVEFQLSSPAPPACRNCCSCPKPLQPPQQGKGLPLDSTDGEGPTKESCCQRNLSLLRSQLASPPKLFNHPCVGQDGFLSKIRQRAQKLKYLLVYLGSTGAAQVDTSVFWADETARYTSDLWASW